MKKFYLLLLVCVLSLVGCKNSSKSSPDGLDGTWKLTEMRTSEDKSYTPWEGDATTFTFDDDYYTTKGYWGNFGGKYTKNDDELTFYAGSKPAMYMTIYELKEDKLILIYEFDYYFSFKRQ